MTFTAIDFDPWFKKEAKLDDIGADLSLEDLRLATNQSIDHLLSLIEGLTDADITFDPVDEEADDPHAKPGEEKIGWSIAHIIVHVTASSEEGAAMSSLLARGIAASERPRYETPWQDVTTYAQCVQRLEESRRIRLAYFDAWPDEPHMDVLRAGVSERFEAYFGKVNATAAALMGLSHEVGHYDQIVDARQQALAARQIT